MLGGPESSRTDTLRSSEIKLRIALGREEVERVDEGTSLPRSLRDDLKEPVEGVDDGIILQTLLSFVTASSSSMGLNGT